MILCKYVKIIGNYQLLKTLGVSQWWLKRTGHDDLYECNEHGQLIMDGAHAKMSEEQYNCLNNLYSVILMDHVDLII